MLPSGLQSYSLHIPTLHTNSAAKMKHQLDAETEGDGTTAILSKWIQELDASQIPSKILLRAKYLILDGIACALVGAHVPWSEELSEALSQYEPEGKCSVIGYSEVRECILMIHLNVY